MGRSASVAHVAVLVTDEPQEVEAQCQEGGAQQVAQSGQVGDGEAVRVFAAPPHGVNHPVRYTQQQQHLEETRRLEDDNSTGVVKMTERPESDSCSWFLITNPFLISSSGTFNGNSEV